MKFYCICVYGRVHGVGFRYAVMNAALKHGLFGTVRNTNDGVEIIVNDKDFFEKVKLSGFARIDERTIEELDLPKFQYKDFRIIG